MKRIQRKRVKGWRIPENTVYVGRGSKWGNPFRIIKRSVIGGSTNSIQNEYDTNYVNFDHPDDAIAESIRRFTQYVKDLIASGKLDIKELKGKNLACWCEITKKGLYVPCHADILLALANNMTLEEVKNENLSQM